MGHGKRNLLADRVVAIQIDEHKLLTPVVLRLAAVRISPKLQVLTEVTNVFIEDVVVPLVYEILKEKGKQECSLFLPGEIVARPVERLVANVVTMPLVEELEHLHKLSRSSATVETRGNVSVHLIFKTQPDKDVLHFAPMDSAAGDSSVRQPGRRQSAGNPTPPVRGWDSHESELDFEYILMYHVPPVIPSYHSHQHTVRPLLPSFVL
jgi:hypothetical protein